MLSTMKEDGSCSAAPNGSRRSSVFLPLSTLPLESGEKVETFLKWCKSNLGMHLSEDVDLFYHFKKDYRGVRALRDIPAGSHLVKIKRLE